MNKIAYWINGKLPIYIRLKDFKRVLGPAPIGYTLAIWNCADCKRYRNLWYVLQDIRITIRKNGFLWKVIKKGDVL